MPRIPSIARALTLALAFSAGAAITVPATEVAAASAKKSKGKAKKAKAKAKKAREARPAKISALSIAAMHKRGDAEEDIVDKVKDAGWVPTAKDERILKAKRVPSSLIAAIKPAPATRTLAAAPAPAPKVDLTRAAAVSEIDFDDVPPPPGTPGWVADKSRKDKAQAQKVDHAARPASSPPAAPPAQAAPAPTMRRVITVSDS